MILTPADIKRGDYFTVTGVEQLHNLCYYILKEWDKKKDVVFRAEEIRFKRKNK